MKGDDAEVSESQFGTACSGNECGRSYGGMARKNWRGGVEGVGLRKESL